MHSLIFSFLQARMDPSTITTLKEISMSLLSDGTNENIAYHQPQALEVTQSGRNHPRHARNALKEKDPLEGVTKSISMSNGIMMSNLRGAMPDRRGCILHPSIFEWAIAGNREGEACACTPKRDRTRRELV